ncbi:hypothetical protein MY3296_002915 [Beauveria thailandica]
MSETRIAMYISNVICTPDYMRAPVIDVEAAGVAANARALVGDSFTFLADK